MRIAVLLIAIAASVGLGQASPAAPVAAAAQCGLPDVRPLWIDYAEGSVAFRNEIFGRPGVIAATSGVVNSEALRTSGAQTVYWWMKLTRLAGTPARPTDPATISAGVEEVFTKAVAASGCETPLIVLNELQSAGSTTPWTPSNTQYRSNVLDLLRGLSARGARTLLLVSAKPYADGEARDWWLRVAEVADIVREVYFPAPVIMRAGVVSGSRTLRQAFRQGIAPFRALGIPSERLGLVIGFQSGPGKGGREGLSPSSTWLRFVKLQTLAAKQVAKEARLGSVVSWGWGTFDQAGADDDKPRAACVYLWSRDEALCDGLAAGGQGFNASRVEGQITVPRGGRCTLDGRVIGTAEVTRLARITGDPDVALAALFARLVESRGRPVSPAAVIEIEQSVVDVRFNGNRSTYLRALRARRASIETARGVIADELRRVAVGRSLRVPAPTGREVALYHATHGTLPARKVGTDSTPSWLGNRRRGYALVPPGPTQVLSLETALSTRVLTTGGAVNVTALDEVVPLGILPLPLARDAIRAALLSQAQARALQGWSVRAQGSALNRAQCLGDRLPVASSVDLTTYLPFLALDA